MIFEVPYLNQQQRNKVRRQLKYGALQCHFELLTGRRCNQGVVLVKVKKDPMDRGRLMKTRFCRAHMPEEYLDKFGIKRFGGPTSTSGNNRGLQTCKPTNPYKYMREVLEEHVIEFLKPYLEALTAEKEVVIGNGRTARMERVPDHRARLQAAEQLLDRVYGKPKQTTMLEGSVDSKVSVEVPQDDDRQLEVAKILAAAGAVNPKIAAASAVADAKSRSN